MTITKEQSTKLSVNLFPVVGIGASAGGLDAFKRLIKVIAPSSGMAYVLVQHLDPTHESLLPELLQKVTKIPVLEITDEVKVLPDHIYIIPSNKMLEAKDGILLLSQRPAKIKYELNMPIDLFFASLAEVHQQHAIGIVLSGTGKDGTIGLQSIKANGGITIVQDEASASYFGMPDNAVKAGVADYVLSPEAIPQKLLDLQAQNIAGTKKVIDARSSDEAVYSKILLSLYKGNGYDFTFYKQPTIRRRIARRMTLNHIGKLSAYETYLQENKKEQEALYLDLLIPVTSFFRDQEIYQTVCKTIFPEILKIKTPGASLRVWVAGCSTGQEAYSLAMCFKEILGDLDEKVQIFATDISAPAIKRARAGVYSKSDIAGISRGRLKKFFTEKDGNYHVKKAVRDMCVFAMHSFIKDPPFSKMDFISCRNVLIYMEPFLQKKALTTFHYALNPNGFLLLGKSETNSSMPELFNLSEKKAKLYNRRQVPASFIHVVSPRSVQTLPDYNEKSKIMNTNFEKAADDVMLRNYVPAGVVVNELMDIVQFRGNTSIFLEQAPGKPTHNLLKLAKNGLGFELRSMLLKVKKENHIVKKDRIALTINGRPQYISIEIIPLPNIVEPHNLVLFYHNIPEIAIGALNDGLAKNTSGNEDVKDLQIAQLEKEMAQSREDMRHITEDQEATNQELQSANEEYLSGSEELQSLNEELETSKEELQSSNEELTSLIEQVTTAWHYAEAIITTIHEPLLVLDKNLIIKKANDAFYKNFNLQPADTENCLIYDLSQKLWNIPLLHTALDEMLPNKATITDFEITINFPGSGERVMHLNATEILREKGDEKLILLSIDDVTEQNLLDTRQQEFRRELELLVQQRTKELSNANQTLLENNDTLVRINQELEIFNYIASHDLQEPVRKIRTFANLLFEREIENLSDKGKHFMTRMVTASIRLQKLIQDLTLYAQAGNKALSFEKTNLNTILEDVITELHENIREKNAVIDIGVLCEIAVIPFQMRQLFNNLVCNSLKFARPGIQPVITIRSATIEGSELHDHLPKEQKYCHIIFTDNGIGFDQQFENKIFQIFQQLNSKNEYPGTGIGLAIVKKVVDNHRGIISVTSELDKGTTFNIYLPTQSIFSVLDKLPFSN
ncbi:MAG: chemotaxis protein CheB [Bacteroidota bacterium]